MTISAGIYDQIIQRGFYTVSKRFPRIQVPQVRYHTYDQDADILAGMMLIDGDVSTVEVQYSVAQSVQDSTYDWVS